MNNRTSRQATSQRVTAVLGPTNTGKTHYAVTRMLAYETGMIGLPLRLLAREIYDRVVEEKGAGAVALITGEEKIAPETATYFICTVESMPVEREVDFVAVDEVQLCADPGAWSCVHRSLASRARHSRDITARVRDHARAHQAITGRRTRAYTHAILGTKNMPGRKKSAAFPAARQLSPSLPTRFTA